MPEIKKRETTEWIKAVAASYGKDSVKSLISSARTKKFWKVNRQYLQHDYYTDIITSIYL